MRECLSMNAPQTHHMHHPTHPLGMGDVFKKRFLNGKILVMMILFWLKKVELASVRRPVPTTHVQLLVWIGYMKISSLLLFGVSQRSKRASHSPTACPDEKCTVASSAYAVEVRERANTTHEHIIRYKVFCRWGVCLNYVTLFNAKPAQSHVRKANWTSLDFSGLPVNIQECPGISMNIQQYRGISMNV